MKNDYAPAPIVVMDGQGRVVSVVKAEEFLKQRPSVGFKAPKVCRMTEEERKERSRNAAEARWGRLRKDREA